MRVAVVVFPGTNCDHDVMHLYGTLLKAQPYQIWHTERELKNPDLVVLPGGFSHGDYLRTGALAKLSPVMNAVRSYAESGGKVLGICNGFQILCEAGLLPGVLLENIGRRFLSCFINMRVESKRSFFTSALDIGEIITCPIAHFQGNYFADKETVAELEKGDQVVFRYCDGDGKIDHDNREINVNGSLLSIAGICNKGGNVIGLMPHPERAAEALIGAIGVSSGLIPFQGTVSEVKVK